MLDPPDETTKLIAALNDKLAADDRVVAVQLTVRDGVTLSAAANRPGRPRLSEAMSATRVDLVRRRCCARRRREVGPFELQLLTFAPNHRIARVRRRAAATSSSCSGRRWRSGSGACAGRSRATASRRCRSAPRTRATSDARADDGARGPRAETREAEPSAGLLRRLRHVRAAASTDDRPADRRRAARRRRRAGRSRPRASCCSCSRRRAAPAAAQSRDAPGCATSATCCTSDARDRRR